ncbi:unnamed protein product [Cladocopium goreaui]|uniref:Uncharacterized protein n=1 Tax=Cladocopium goreaui TaxID=2562237 RepID=A0A9P1BZZ3_9DINO|nr:unnamed protein product [Cladocopium goreaui]
MSEPPSLPNGHPLLEQLRSAGLEDLPTKFWAEAQTVLWPADDPTDVTELHEDRVQHLIENYKSDGYILQLASFYREWQSERAKEKSHMEVPAGQTVSKEPGDQMAHTD